LHARAPPWHSDAMILRAFTLSLRQLNDARTFRLVAAVAALSLLVFALLGAALWLLLDHWVMPRWFPQAEGFAAFVAVGLTILLGWFLFRAVAMAVMGLFTDGIVESVEEDHYPAAAARATPVSFARGVAMGLRSARRTIGWNLLAAPFYLLLLVTGVGTLVLALLVNMLLLGRDLEAMVLARHPGMAALSARDRNLLGLAASALFLIPVVNLLAPVLGAAMAVHMLHGRQAAFVQ
jgi:CysZ protein